MATAPQPAEKPNDGLALVVGGLFILAIVFAAYNYFSKQNQDGNKLADGENVSLVDKVEDEKKEEEKGDVNGEGTTSEKLEEAVKEEVKAEVAKEVKGTIPENTDAAKVEVPAKPVVTAQPQTDSSLPVWTANNYQRGEIKAGSYTVKSGDTLWEIAEATYGNGAGWVKILNANKGSIGFLSNGTQALIRPGQVLVLP